MNFMRLKRRKFQG